MVRASACKPGDQIVVSCPLGFETPGGLVIPKTLKMVHVAFSLDVQIDIGIGAWSTIQ